MSRKEDLATSRREASRLTAGGGSDDQPERQHRLDAAYEYAHRGCGAARDQRMGVMVQETVASSVRFITSFTGIFLEPVIGPTAPGS